MVAASGGQGLGTGYMPAERPPPYHILYVDDEEKTLHYFREIFGGDYIVHTAMNAADGGRILQSHGPQIGLILTDQRMPGASGVELLGQARKLCPNAVRMLVTAYADYQTAVDAVNDGRVFRYIHKPWDPEELAHTIRHALDYHQVLIERERLLAEKAETMRHMLAADRVAGLGILAQGLNHHLRNALTVVRAFVDLAPLKMIEELRGAPPRDGGFWLDIQNQAASQIDRIQALLARLADASQSKQLERLDECVLQDVIREMLDVFEPQIREKNLGIEVSLDPELPALRVHGARFHQMWRLLFIEEITHLTPGDKLHISASARLDASGHEQLTITLRDTGIWDSGDRAVNFFDPFFTRSSRPDEFGVNMMAIYVTMHLHGGTAEASLLEPRGIEIRLSMPLDPDTCPQEEQELFRKISQHERRWQEREERTA